MTTRMKQDQVTGSVELHDDVQLVDLEKPNRTLGDDLDALRSQLKRVLGSNGRWTDDAAIDLSTIKAMFTGSLDVNQIQGASALKIGEMLIRPSGSAIGTSPVGFLSGSVAGLQLNSSGDLIELST